MTLARAEGVYVGRDGGDGDVGGADGDGGDGNVCGGDDSDDEGDDGSGNGDEAAAEPLAMIEATAEAEAMAA